MDSSRILDLDATEIVERYRQNELTVTDVVRTYVKHLQHVNESIHAVVEERYQTAIREAQKLEDERRTRGVRGRFFGVPISVKECFDVAGMHTTGGLAESNVPVKTEDAYTIAKLRQEGAVILAKTNTPALCFCQESDNKRYGRTNNPWDLSRTCGGSSGGEGAAVAVGGSAVGVGADIGGSIRFPAHFNGVVGFKSGGYSVCADGVFPPITEALQQPMLGIGALGKSVRDCKLMHEVFTGKAVPPFDQNIRITLPKTLDKYPLSEETQNALRAVTEELGRHFPVFREDPPLFEDIALIWQQVMSLDGGAENRDRTGMGGTLSVFSDYLLERLWHRGREHRYLTWALFGARMFKPSKRRILEIREVLQSPSISEFFRDRILITPVYHRGAPRHGELYRELFSIRKTFLKYMPYVALGNVFGLSCLTIPVGTDELGMPLSVQLMSTPDLEGSLFQAGEILTAKFRGYRRCSRYDGHEMSEAAAGIKV